MNQFLFFFFFFFFFFEFDVYCPQRELQDIITRYGGRLRYLSYCSSQEGI